MRIEDKKEEEALRGCGGKPVRWGIMGTGRIAGIFCEALKALPQAEIYAVGSRTPAKARTFAGGCGAEKAYGSYEEFAADEKIDIVYVATPIACHYENVRLCLEAGRNVLCEKAFTQRAGEAEELWALAREKGLFLMEALWTKCQPVFQKIQEWKREGAFGEIQAVEARFYTSATRDHRLMRNPAQGGSLYDLTIYPLMYACALLGYEPGRVSAAAARSPEGVDTMESILLQYENGAFAGITGGLSCERRASLYIHGTKGRVLIDQEHFYKAQRAVLTGWDNEPLEIFEAPFAVNGYEYEALEAMNCILQGKTESALVSMEETIAVIRLMERCAEKF